jgi:hypothetical protein
VLMCQSHFSGIKLLLRHHMIDQHQMPLYLQENQLLKLINDFTDKNCQGALKNW